MKRIYVIIMATVLVLATGCQRYDMPLDDLFYPTSQTVAEETANAMTGEVSSARDASLQATATATSRPIVTASPTPTKVAPDTTAVTYTVQPGDNLLQIAIAYGTTVESLMAINGLSDADQLSVGQELQVSFDANVTGPERVLVPDSEIVFSSAFATFDINAYVDSQRGFLSTYIEDVGYDTLTGAQIVELVSLQYSVGPRVLLAMLELRSGWVTQAAPSEETLTFPLEYTDLSYYTGLYHQLCVAADSFNTGFYGWQDDSLWMVHSRDGTFIRLSEHLNPGTAAIHRALAGNSLSYESWMTDIDRFMDVYKSLFGDPFMYAVEPIIPPEADPITMVLPWQVDETWYLTGGPHAGFGSVGIGSAVDFVTPERNIGCMTSQYWATAITAGLVVYSHDGLVLIDYDQDGDITTGWVIVYMHMAEDGRVEPGTIVNIGDPIGHPSCEGGVSNASHLHLARRYNGMWIAADDERFPMVLSGWMAVIGDQAYDGQFVRDKVIRTACECWDDQINGMTH